LAIPLPLHEILFFTEINQLIIRFKQFSVPTNSSGSVTEINDLFEEAEKKIPLLEGYFLQGLLSFHQQEEQLVWVSNIQRMIRIFSDAVYSSRKQLTAIHHAALKTQWMQKTEQFLSAIQSFMDSLQKEHAGLFDDSQLISHYEADTLRREFSVQLKQLYKNLSLKSKADEKLKKIACLPFEEFIAASTERQAHSFISFLKELISSIENISFTGDAGKDTELLMNCLIVVNYNEIGFIQKGWELILQRIKELEDTASQLECLYLQQKQLHLLLRDNRSGYYKSAAPVSDTLDCFMEEEIRYLSRKMPTRISSLIETGKPVTVRVSIPVSSIAILLRLLVDKGAIETDNQTQFIKMIAAYLKNKNDESFSSENLRNKYYSPPANHLIAVKELLFDMIKGINSLLR